MYLILMWCHTRIGWLQDRTRMMQNVRTRGSCENDRIGPVAHVLGSLSSNVGSYVTDTIFLRLTIFQVSSTWSLSFCRNWNLHLLELRLFHTSKHRGRWFEYGNINKLLHKYHLTEI